MISVISVTYNSNRVIRGAFKDLLNKSDVEIFVVDNDSVDNTVEILNNIKADNINIIENMKNVGYGRANNIALKQASGEFVLLLNPDASISYEKLNYLVKVMNNNQDIAIIAPTLTDNLMEVGIKSDIPKLKEVDYVIFGLVLIRKTLLDKIGLFDENIFMYFEDIDICKRAKDAGFKICECQNILAYHQGGGSSGRSIATVVFKEKQMEKARMYYKMKHFGHKYQQKLMHLRYLAKYSFLFLVSMLTFQNGRVVKYYGRICGILASLGISLYRNIGHN